MNLRIGPFFTTDRCPDRYGSVIFSNGSVAGAADRSIFYNGSVPGSVRIGPFFQRIGSKSCGSVHFLQRIGARIGTIWCFCYRSVVRAADRSIFITDQCTSARERARTHKHARMCALSFWHKHVCKTSIRKSTNNCEPPA